MTVRLRLLLVLATISGVAILAMSVPFVATSLLLENFERASRVSIQSSTAFADLVRSVSEQEAGVSAYVLTQDQDFADQYHAGVAAERSAYELLDEGEGTADSIRAGFDRVRDATTEWRAGYAVPTLDDVRTGRLDSARSQTRFEDGKTLYNVVRARTADLDALMASPEAQLGDEVDGVMLMLITMYAIGIVTVVAGLVIGVKLTRDWISRPLRTLVATARQVEQGENVPFLAGRRDEIGDLGAALERMRRRIVAGQQSAESAVEQSNILNNFTELTAFTQTDIGVSEALLTAISELIHPDAAVVHVANRSRDRAIPEATLGNPTAEMLALRTLDNCPGVRRGSMYVTADVSKPLAVRCPIQPAEQGTVVCLPLTALGETIGATHLTWSGPDAIPLTLRPTLSRIAEHAALSIGNRRLVRALQSMANTDARTGLPNSRAFDEAVEAALGGRSGDSPDSILLLDLDHFKAFNDRYGHPAGDEALRAFAGILRTSIREGDIAARYGGEEFAVHLRGLGRAEALEVADRIRSRVESAILSLGPGITGRITTSIGVAVAPADGTERISLLKAADGALYTAKNEGRNRVATTLDARPPAASRKPRSAAS